MFEKPGPDPTSYPGSRRDPGNEVGPDLAISNTRETEILIWPLNEKRPVGCSI